MLISDEVHIWREPDGDYHVEWRASHPETEVKVEPLAAHDAVQAHYHDTGSRARITGLAPGSRHYFRVSDQHGNEVLSTERKLGLEGTPNFRDFGGYRTADDRQVKWGYLFRSGQLSGLSDRDIDLLASLIGLSGIGARVREIIQGVQDWVDQAASLDKLELR